jgi:hypothetical protein
LETVVSVKFGLGIDALWVHQQGKSPGFLSITMDEELDQGQRTYTYLILQVVMWKETGN